MAERDEEIRELKARLERLEGEPGGAKPKKAPLGGWKWVGLGLLALVGIGAVVGGGDPPPAPAPTEAAAPAPCDKARSSDLYEMSRRNGVIRGVDISAGEGVVVMVAPGLWRRLDFHEQQVVAAALDCAIASPGYLRELRFRADRSGADLYALKSYDLLKLRRDGLAGR